MTTSHQIIVPYGQSDPSARARAFAWADRAGADATSVVVAGRGMSGTRNTVRQLSRRVPTVVVLRHVSPFAQGVVEGRILRSANFGVYELDDGLPWDNGRLDGHRGLLKTAFPKSRIARAAARAADRVIAGNEVLAEWASAHCDDVVVIPTCVDPSAYERKTRYDVSERPVIGWIGTPATEPHLRVAAQGIAAMHRRHGARFVVMSSGTRPIDDEVDSFVERMKWSEHAARTALATWDVGIMPLPDTTYARSKCAYKLLQYGAVGLPSLGSPVGASRAVLDATGSSAVATPSDWVDALDASLTAATGARSEAGDRASRAVADGFSYHAWFERWRSAVGLDGPSQPALGARVDLPDQGLDG